ncbi:hypothetical protein AB0M32_21870 [Streptomyces sp. NPDC051985]|uniref:hypothetical protein n=1 Tax=Streptomyces sp. NPDC051985 TaxID=3155807 RepID=UPI003435A911
MPDTPDAPDFLDRLIARHTAPRPAATRARPRLPGPFERVEAVRTTAPGTAAPLWPTTAPAAVPETAAPDPALGETRTTHTERERTVVHREPPVAPAEPAVRRPVAPLLRPAAPVAAAVPRPTASGAVRPPAGRARPETSPISAPVPVPPGTDAVPDGVSAAPRPRAADTAAARDAVRQAAARRPARAAAEQVVQVQIGRLEVTAAAAGDGRRRPPAKERAGAALGLAEYLADREGPRN